MASSQSLPSVTPAVCESIGFPVFSGRFAVPPTWNSLFSGTELPGASLLCLERSFLGFGAGQRMDCTGFPGRDDRLSGANFAEDGARTHRKKNSR